MQGRACLCVCTCMYHLEGYPCMFSHTTRVIPAYVQMNSDFGQEPLGSPLQTRPLVLPFPRP